jgi:hypothetical protein
MDMLSALVIDGPELLEPFCVASAMSADGLLVASAAE